MIGCLVKLSGTLTRLNKFALHRPTNNHSWETIVDVYYMLVLTYRRIAFLYIFNEVVYMIRPIN